MYLWSPLSGVFSAEPPVQLLPAGQSCSKVTSEAPCLASITEPRSMTLPGFLVGCDMQIKNCLYTLQHSSSSTHVTSCQVTEEVSHPKTHTSTGNPFFGTGDGSQGPVPARQVLCLSNAQPSLAGVPLKVSFLSGACASLAAGHTTKM